MTKMVMGRSRVFLGPSKAENSAYSVHRVNVICLPFFFQPIYIRSDYHVIALRSSLMRAQGLVVLGVCVCVCVCVCNLICSEAINSRNVKPWIIMYYGM